MGLNNQDDRLIKDHHLQRNYRGTTNGFFYVWEFTLWAVIARDGKLPASVAEAALLWA